MFARILLDWVRVPGEHPVGKVRSALATIVDPILIPLRRIIPPVRMGGAALDLSAVGSPDRSFDTVQRHLPIVDAIEASQTNTQEQGGEG